MLGTEPNLWQRKNGDLRTFNVKSEITNNYSETPPRRRSDLEGHKEKIDGSDILPKAKLHRVCNGRAKIVSSWSMDCPILMEEGNRGSTWIQQSGILRRRRTSPMYGRQKMVGEGKALEKILLVTLVAVAWWEYLLILSKNMSWDKHIWMQILACVLAIKWSPTKLWNVGLLVFSG